MSVRTSQSSQSLTQAFVGLPDPPEEEERAVLRRAESTASLQSAADTVQTEAISEAEPDQRAGSAPAGVPRPPKRQRANTADGIAGDHVRSSEQQSRFFAGPTSGDAASIEGNSDNDSDDFARAKPPVPPPAREAPGPAQDPDLHDAADDRNTCSVCLEPWTVSGPHRLVSLKCGHLFGQNCAKRWLRKSSQQRARQKVGRSRIAGKCPECNQHAEWRDIRPIYARSISAMDGQRLYELQAEIRRLAELKAGLEAERTDYCLRYSQMRNEVVRLRSELDDSVQRCQWLEIENAGMGRQLREAQAQTRAEHEPDLSLPDPLDVLAAEHNGDPAEQDPTDSGPLEGTYTPLMRLRATVPIATQKGESSRLLVVHPHEQLVYASYSKPMLSMHTLVQVDARSPESPAYVLSLPHRQEIRGAAVSPSPTGARYMLTASQDQTAAVCALGYGASAASSAGAGRTNPMLAATIKAGLPCWSCAWDRNDPNICYIGTHRAQVLAFDLRHATSPVHRWDGPQDGVCLPPGPAADPQGASLATGYSPIHSIVVLPSDEYGERLVVANSTHLFSLPPRPDRTSLADAASAGQDRAHSPAPWTRLAVGDDAPGRACYSLSYDEETGCIAASFRAQDMVTRAPTTEHDLFQPGADRHSWSRRRPRITVASAQTKMARSTVFSYWADVPTPRRQTLFCAGVEATRTVKAWCAGGQGSREQLSLGGVPETEDIVDVKGWQWGSGANALPPMFASLTNSTIRLYDVR